MEYRMEGGSLPALIINLEAGEKLISEAGGRTWVKGEIETESTSNGGVGKAIGRLFSGESLFLSKYTAKTPAEIAFTSSFPGKIIVKELAEGESVICQKSAFLCGTTGIDISIHLKKKFSAGLVGGEGFIMQKITGPGTVFFELDGYTPEYELAAGEKIVCDTGVVAIMDSTCTMEIQTVKGVKNMFFGGEGFFDTVVHGPGKVCLQTMTIEKLAGKIGMYIPSKSN